MHTIKSPCSNCSFRGYSREICKLHSKKTLHGHSCSGEKYSWKFFGKKAVIGAGIGVTGIFAGLAVLPAFGLKVILGHSLAAMSGAGGAIGASTNVAIHHRKKSLTSVKKRKRNLLLPKYWRKENG